MSAAITVEHLTKTYGPLVAVDDLSFHVESGETYALLGPNGAGKTTTVEILEGLRRRTGGSVEVLGLDPIREHRSLHRRIGVMLQEGGIFQTARALEVIRLFAAFHDHAQDPEELLQLVGLEAKAATPFRRLSGGEKQKLSLALVLVGNPRLVFLDEPTAGMDPSARRTTWQLIRRMQEEGVTVILTTHYLEEAEQLADRVGIIDHGRMIAEGTPLELMHAGARATFTAEPGLPVEALAPLAVTEREPGRYIIDVEPATPEVLATVTRWLAEQGVLLRDLRVGATGLEEVFIELTEDRW